MMKKRLLILQSVLTELAVLANLIVILTDEDGQNAEAITAEEWSFYARSAISLTGDLISLAGYQYRAYLQNRLRELLG